MRVADTALPPPDLVYWSEAAVSPDGALYAIDARADSALRFYASEDLGLTWRAQDLWIGHNPQLAAGTGGVVDVVYFTDARQSEHRRSRDGGRSWSAATAVGPVPSILPAIARAPDGTLAVAWWAETPPYTVALSVSADGRGWGAPVALANPPDWPYFERAAAHVAWTDAGRLLVCWRDDVRGTADDHDALVCRFSIDDGASFAPPVEAVRAESHTLIDNGDLLVRAPGDVLLPFSARGGTYATRSTDGGRTWTPPALVDADPELTWASAQRDGHAWLAGGGGDPFVYHTPDGVTWTEVAPPADAQSCLTETLAVLAAGGGNAFATGATYEVGPNPPFWWTGDGGATWSEPRAGRSYRAPVEGTTLVETGGGRLLALWSLGQGASAPLLASTSTDGGLTWSPPASASDVARAPRGPIQNAPDAYLEPDPALDVTAAGSGAVAVWTARGAGGCSEVRASRSPDGVMWEASQPLDADGTRVTVAADGTGRLVAAWADSAGTRFSLARSADGGASWSAPAVIAAPAGSGTLWTSGVEAAPDGSLVVLTVDSDAPPNDLVARRSSDGGATWTSAVIASSSAASLGWPQLVAAGPRLLALAWDATCELHNCDDTLYALESGDSGLSWSPVPVPLPAPGFGLPGIALVGGDPSGNAYAETGAGLMVLPGMITKEKDTMSQFSKAFTYDLSSRLKSVRFLNGATDDEAALNLTWNSATQLTWSRAGTGQPATGVIKFDEYGRRRQVRITSADACAGSDPAGCNDAVQILKNDAFGNPAFQGDWCRSTDAEPDCSGSTYINYDPFHRPGAVLRDGYFQHGFTYAGLSTYHRYCVRYAATGTEQPFEVLSTYDGFGRLISVKEPDPQDSFNRLRQTDYTYDALDRLTSAKMYRVQPPPADESNWSFTYDGHGNLRQSTTPEAGTTLFQIYDARGHLIRSKDSDNVTANRTYDCAERLTSVAAGSVTRQNTWDGTGPTLSAPGRLIRDEYHNDSGTVVARDYAYSGRLGRLSDITTGITFGPTEAYAFSSNQTYNSLGQLDTLNYPTVGALDRDGARPIAAIQLTYDRGFLKSASNLHPSSQAMVTSVLYDPSAAVRKLEFENPSPSSIATTRTFDTHNRLTRITGSAGGFDTGGYEYDRSDDVTAIGADKFLYLGLHELASAEISGGPTIGYSYQFGGSMTSRSGTEPFTVSVNSANRIFDPGYTYSSTGDLTAVPGTSYSFDAMHRLVSTSVAGAAGYVYDADGNRAAMELGSDGCVTGERFFTIRDESGKLLSEYQIPTGCSGHPTWVRDYVYAGRELLGAVENATLAAPLLYFGGPYDPGCMQQKLVMADNPSNACRSRGVSLFRRAATNPNYDFTAPVGGGSPSCSARLDYPIPNPSANDCYVLRSVHWSGELGPLSAEVCFPQANPCIPVTQPCQPLTVPQFAAGRRYYFSDHLGTPRVTVTSSGSVISAIKLGPFGEPLTGTSCQRKLFTGHERDDRTGLDYMLARYYSRKLGRFLTADPLHNSDATSPQAWNSYAYVRNNPLSRIDPSGLKDMIYLLQTLPINEQQPLKKIIERVKDTKKKVEATNRATKKEITDVLKKADRSDIVVFFGHANSKGFQTNEGVTGGTDTLTIGEIQASFAKGATCVIGGCRSAPLAAAAAQGGATDAFGFSEITNAGVGAAAVIDLVSSLAHGGSADDAKAAGNAALNSPLNTSQSEVVHFP